MFNCENCTVVEKGQTTTLKMCGQHALDLHVERNIRHPVKYQLKGITK